jgi:hypothetical protein
MQNLGNSLNNGEFGAVTYRDEGGECRLEKTNEDQS